MGPSASVSSGAERLTVCRCALLCCGDNEVCRRGANKQLFARRSHRARGWVIATPKPTCTHSKESEMYSVQCIFLDLILKHFFLQVKARVFCLNFENTTNTTYYPLYRTCVKSQNNFSDIVRSDQEKKRKHKILCNTFCLIHSVDLDYEVHCTFALDN